MVKYQNPLLAKVKQVKIEYYLKLHDIKIILIIIEVYIIHDKMIIKAYYKVLDINHNMNLDIEMKIILLIMKLNDIMIIILKYDDIMYLIMELIEWKVIYIIMELIDWKVKYIIMEPIEWKVM